MINLTVNGQSVEFIDSFGSRKLLAILRDELRLTSVKEGCGEGACGTCMVLIDGKPTRACIPTLTKTAGKQVVTVEGLSVREKEVYAHCFAAAGAVQCGFCIPGMVIGAKGLLDQNPSPNKSDVKKAIRGNICRCTGYTKIEDAILMAAEYLRGGTVVPKTSFTGRLGEDFYRLDAAEKTLGTGLYADDMVIDGMVYAKALRAKYPRAKVLSMDTAMAASHPECIRVITAEDVPGEIKCGHLVRDWDALIAVGGITRYVGDTVAIAVTNSKESLDEVLALIDVKYEELTALTSPKESLAEDAPKIHDSGNLLSLQKLKRGDADVAIAASKYAVTKHYSLPFTEHAFMEPECAIAMPDGEDGLLLYTGGQSIYDEQREICGLLNLPTEKVRVKSMLVGGGFGGKEDMSVQHHAALSAWLVKRPVKVKLSRAESLVVHPKRHAMEIDMTTACNEDGIITAVKAEIVSDTGAYASLGGPVLQRACTHAGGPYHYHHIDITGRAVYTNNPPAGAFRGFGVTQSAFAMENNLNLLADIVGISPWEIRYINAIRPGQKLPNGQLADDSTDLVGCLMAVKDIYNNSACAGIASCFKNAGLGVGVPDAGRCVISIERGKIHVRSSAACIGQGMLTVLTQMVCETLRVPPSFIVAEKPDTARTPNSGTTTASRQTTFSGEAAVLAAIKLREELINLNINVHINDDAVSDTQAISDALSSLEGREFYGEYKPETDSMGSNKPNPVSHVSYGYAAQVAELDDSGKLIRITAAYDLGTVVNPKSAEGQIEGGIVMGMGYALTEDYPVVNGYPLARYGKLGLFRATEIPELRTILMTRDSKLPAAYGAKGVGELATIPTAPAISGAYHKLDGVFRTKLPLENTFYRNQ